MIRIVVQAGNTNVQRNFRRFFPKLKKGLSGFGNFAFFNGKN